jgi:hypothetical protein
LKQDHAFAIISEITAFRTSSSNGTVVCFLDTAATHHFEPERAKFIYLKLCEPYMIEIADGKVHVAKEKGAIRFACKGVNGFETVKLSDVHYTPLMSTPLISVSHLREKGVVSSTINSKVTTLESEESNFHIKVAVKDGVYPLTMWKPGNGKAAAAAKQPTSLFEAH